MTGTVEPRPLGGREGSRDVPVEVVVLAVLAVAVGTVVRFWAPSPLWLDEALSVNIASLPVPDLLEALRSDGHPPGYYLLLHAWIELFGDSNAAVRALSGVLSLAALPLAWVVGNRLAGRLGGWCVLALTAASPFLVRYATEARMYALVSLLVLAGWLVADDLFRGRSARWRVPLGAVLGGALVLTHYWGWFLLSVLGAAAVWRAWRHRGAARSGALAVIGSLVGAGVLFVPWLSGFLTQLSSTGTPWAPPMRPTAAVGLTLLDVAGGDVREGILGAGLLTVLGFLALFARAECWGDREVLVIWWTTTPLVRAPALIAAATLGVGTVVAVATESTYASRYGAVVVPIIVVVAAMGIAVVPKRVPRALLLGAALSLVFVGVAAELRGERTQLAALAELVDAHAEPGDVVVYCPDQLGPAGHRVMPAGVVQVVYPTLAGPERVDWVDYEARNRAADPVEIAEQVLSLADGRAVFLVWNRSYRTFEGQCEALRDQLGAARPQAEVLAEAEGDRFFEHASLTWFAAP